MHIHLSDQYQFGHSLLHDLDPRVKVVSALAFILAVSLAPEGGWWVFGIYLGLVSIAAWTTGLGLFYALRRSTIVLPFVLAALALPFTTPGEVLLELPLAEWAISREGLVRAATIVVRAWIAVQAAILLTATTPFPNLLWSLEALRVPRPLISLGAFTYRYLFVLADESLRMIRARQARSAHSPGAGRPSARWQIQAAGAMVGALFLRAVDRSERVYAAMLSRGYDGRSRISHPAQASRGDALALALALLLVVAPLVFARLE